MTKAKQSGAFKGHRFPSEIISYPVWAYFRFPMSFRDVEYILYKRGVIVRVLSQTFLTIEGVSSVDALMLRAPQTAGMR